MRTPLSPTAEAYSPDGTRASSEGKARSAEWLARLLALLMLFLTESFNTVRLLRHYGLPSCWHDRPDLPPGSAQAEAAAVRGPFGNAIAWMCRRHGVGPGHPDWPELSCYILMFGGSLAKCRPGHRPSGLQWWENPYIVPGLVVGFGIPTAASASLLEQQAVADARPAPPHAMQAEAANAVRAEASRAKLPASWLAASEWHVYARAGPSPPTGPPDCPGLLTSIMSFHGAGAWPAPPS